jgi:hypothetical protein
VHEHEIARGHLGRPDHGCDDPRLGCPRARPRGRSRGRSGGSRAVVGRSAWKATVALPKPLRRSANASIAGLHDRRSSALVVRSASACRLNAIRRPRDAPLWKLEASLKCRLCRTLRYASPAPMIRLGPRFAATKCRIAFEPARLSMQVPRSRHDLKAARRTQNLPFSPRLRRTLRQTCVNIFDSAFAGNTPADQKVQWRCNAQPRCHDKLVMPPAALGAPVWWRRLSLKWSELAMRTFITHMASASSGVGARDDVARSRQMIRATNGKSFKPPFHQLTCIPSNGNGSI